MKKLVATSPEVPMDVPLEAALKVDSMEGTSNSNSFSKIGNSVKTDFLSFEKKIESSETASSWISFLKFLVMVCVSIVIVIVSWENSMSKIFNFFSSPLNIGVEIL